MKYKPGTMSWMAGYAGPQGDVGFMMEADYSKAQKIIEERLAEGRNIALATMGLDGDWECNHTVVYEDGAHYDYKAWHHSGWAIPTLVIEYADGSEEVVEVWTKGEDS